MLQLNKKNKLTFKQNLVDDVLDENNPFNNKIKTEDIYIEDNLFDDSNSRHKSFLWCHQRNTFW